VDAIVTTGFSVEVDIKRTDCRRFQLFLVLKSIVLD
jgi:hypothetical protein